MLISAKTRATEARTTTRENEENAVNDRRPTPERKRRKKILGRKSFLLF
jgi:hypothetical protein